MSVLMPKGFILPNGNAVRARVYIDSWRTLKRLPRHEEVKGWNWYATPAGRILDHIMEGIHDRINKRGGLVIRECSEKRLWKLKELHIQCECRDCGTPLCHYAERTRRFCSDCYRNYF